MKTGAFFTLVLSSVLLSVVLASPEPGFWNVTLTTEHNHAMFTKSLYKGSEIKVRMTCTSKQQGVKLRVRYAARMTQCQGEFSDIDDQVAQDRADEYISKISDQFVDNEHVLYFLDLADKWFVCDGSAFSLADHGDRDWLVPAPSNFSIIDTDKENAGEQEEEQEEQTPEATVTKPKKQALESSIATSAASKKSGSAAKKKPTSTKSVESIISREKRDASAKVKANVAAQKAGKQSLQTKTTKASVSATKISVTQSPSSANGLQRIAIAKEDGIYLFAFAFDCAKPEEDTVCDFSLSMTVEMHHDLSGYLSAIDWPQLPFYATMCAVYSIYTLTWIVLCICYWRELIRLQFWIAAVILLGLVEKAIFLAEYRSVFATGLSVLPGAVVIAEIVSALKRSLARILIVIVSVGFGIVRPRLGPIFNRILIIGGFYFVCASIEGCLRQLNPKGDNSWRILVSVFPLALIDAILCCWIFTSLVHTIRQLRVRRNVVKLSLYKHFTNVLIFAVLASLVYMVWSAVEHKMTACVVDWKELWMDEAFWQMLFSTILLVIIVLFRPSNNAVKYAFQPLLDADEDGEAGSEEDEVVMTNLSEDVKKKQRVGDKEKDKDRDGGKTQSNPKGSDDLKWVEDNIPVTDGVLPSLLDSDEEIMASKYELNKME